MADSDPPQSDTEAAIWKALQTVDDPELGINVVDLVLIYGVSVEGGRVEVRMTMTTPACPLGPHLSNAIEEALLMQVPGVEHVEVEIVWDPPWHPGLMSPDVGSLFGRR